MAHMLSVAARQLGHPVPLFVLMETRDALLHSPDGAAGVLCLPGKPPS